MSECQHCLQFGLRFERDYEPWDFIEGNRNARIWVIGLNPAQDTEWRDARSKEDLLSYFDDEKAVHKYFKQFKAVSERLYESFGKEGGAAHTDLVKCSSKSWPPEGLSGSDRGKIISKCARYLERQIKDNWPQVIVCNGREVSLEIKRILPPPAQTLADATAYVYEDDGKRVTVVLSGFIGRIDNYAKRRLGREIEAALSDMQGNEG